MANESEKPTNMSKNAAKGLTCVCPSDEAFAAFGDLANTAANLTAGLGSLLATLTRHGLTGSYYTTNFTDGDLIQSQNGYPILVTRRDGLIFLNDAQLVGMNYIARTGAVHALDRVCAFFSFSQGGGTKHGRLLLASMISRYSKGPGRAVQRCS